MDGVQEREQAYWEAEDRGQDAHHPVPRRQIVVALCAQVEHWKPSSSVTRADG